MWTKRRSIQFFRAVVAMLPDFNHPYVEIAVLETHLLKVSALCGQRQSHGGVSGSSPLFKARGSRDSGGACAAYLNVTQRSGKISGLMRSGPLSLRTMLIPIHRASLP